MVLDVKDQAASMLGLHPRDLVADKMVGGIDGKSPNQHEKDEQRQRKPLVFGFLLEQSSPPSSHALCWGVRPMKTLFPDFGNGGPTKVGVVGGDIIKGASVAGMLGGRPMARKPAVMYRRLKGPAYTRRKYIGGVPNNRIMQFHVGNRRAAETGQFQVVLELRADNDVQIRHTALEAARVVSNSTIRNQAGAQGYALRVHTFPHHVLRENKQATGAGADRVSQGMRCAFGKNVGTAARVKRGQRVISIQVNADHYLTARDALRKASMKFPTPCTIRLIRGHEHLKGLI